jgi:cytoskeletal protein CcmA (bactofilin family)
LRRKRGKDNMLGKGKSTETTVGKLNTIIGEDSVLEGILNVSETARVDGTIKGEVKSKGTIIIGTSGKVIGNIATQEIVIAGRVEGDINALGKVEITSTGRIYGDIRTKSIIIDENAIFQGKCMMDEGRMPEPEVTVPDIEVIKE